MGKRPRGKRGEPLHNHFTGTRVEEPQTLMQMVSPSLKPRNKQGAGIERRSTDNIGGRK